MVEFRYLPLPEDGKHIRLLTLSPGEPQDELHLQLNVTPLNIGQHYEALSYFWGSPILEVKVTIGVSAGQYLLVTQNLATALRHLRHTHEPRVLWVDAVCMYSYQTATKCCRNLRFRPQFCERVVLPRSGKTYAPCFQEKLRDGARQSTESAGGAGQSTGRAHKERCL
jgi:hypothetical protein